MKRTMKKLAAALMALCMVLSLMPAGALATADVITVYVSIDSDTAPYIYAWGDYGSAFSSWPGVAMTGDGDWWKMEVPLNTTGILINNGAGTQSSEIYIDGSKDCWITLSADYAEYSVSYSEINDDVTEQTTVTITAEVPSDCTAAYCYSWVYGAAGPVWPGDAMTQSGDIWTVEIPADCDRVIISDGSSIQTIDLVITPGEDAHIILGDTVGGKYNATVYQGEAVPQEPVVSSYYVTGSTDVFSNWSEYNQDGKMTEQDGIYIKKFTGVPQGDYEIKVNDGSWYNSWGDDSDDSGNYCFDVAWNDATVIVQFDPATETVSVEVRAPVVAQVPDLSDGYYGIYNADQLYWFAEQVNSGNTAINGKLMADIVVNENVLKADGSLNGDGSNFRVWMPMGYYNDETDQVSYSGTFDGNGKCISGLYVDIDKISVGLFSRVGTDGVVKNLGVADSYIKGRHIVGSVVGLNSGTVRNCYNAGSVIGQFSVGGVLGRIFESTAYDCYNIGYVSGVDDVGGILGDIYSSGTVDNCYYLSGCCTDENEYGIAMTAEQFASGEVAFMLQGEQTEEVWGQDIGTEKYPTLGGKKVYQNQAGNCDGQAHYEYSNWKSSPVEGHWWEWIITVGRTCTESGLAADICSICGETGDTTEIPATGHYYHHEVTSQPTCTEYGIVTHTCTVCGHTYTDSETKDLHTVFDGWLASFDLCDQDPFMTVLLGLQNRLNPMYHLGCDWSDKCIKTISAEEFEAEVDRRIALNDTLLTQIRSYFGYDEQTQTYNFSHGGGWGGATYERECVGYVNNGNTYTVFFENRVLEGLPEEGYDYLSTFEILPVQITFEGKVYQHLGGGDYYYIVSYTGSGNRYEVEYDGNIVRILSWDTYGPEDKPAEFDQGIYPDLNPTGHSWTAATCTAPKTCTVCGLTEGEKLGHIEKIVTPGYAATVDAPGLTDHVVCGHCGDTLQEQVVIDPIAEEIVFSYKASGINGSTNAVNSGYITVEIWMNVNSEIARVWGTDIDLQFNENLTLLSVDGGGFQESLSTPLSIANRDKAVKLTQDMGYSGDKTFRKGQYLFATLTFKVDKAFCGQDASFIVNLEECAVARDDYANDLIVYFGSGTAIQVSMLGDANADGKITTADARSLSRWFAAADLDDYEAVFDLNKDGYVDGDDFALLRGAIVRDNSYLDI